MQDDRDGRLVWSSVETADYRATGASPEDAEGLSDLLSQSATGELVVLLREVDGGRTKISVRTRDGGQDATELTGAFGGGGHARAAGATLAQPLREATESVLGVARQMLDRAGG
jgi:phosphoesterase RecJ-like protein